MTSAYYYKRLSQSEKQAYDFIVDKINKYENDFFVWGIKANGISLKNIISAISFDHPEVFYLDFSYTCIFERRGIRLMLNYTYAKNEIIRLKDEMEKSIGQILNNVRKKAVEDVWDQEKAVHDIIVRNIKYHYAAKENPGQYPEAYTIVGAFIHKKAICEGIAKAFQLLLEKLNIECLRVSGVGKGEGAHAWNLVRLEGQYCPVDVTWDLNHSQNSQGYRYDYFNLAKDDFDISHSATGLECIIRNDDQFTFFARKGALIKSRKMLGEYVRNQLHEKKKHLNFKIQESDKLPRNLGQYIDKKVMEILFQYGITSYLMIHNLPHKIFYYRFEGR